MKILTNSVVIVVILIITLGMSSIGNAQQTNIPVLVDKAQQVGVPPGTVFELRERGREYDIKREKLASVFTVVIEMKEEQLPVDFAIRKVFEGFVKGIPSDDVVSLLQKLQNNTVKAARIIDPWLEKDGVREMLIKQGQSKPEFRDKLVETASASIIRGTSVDAMEHFLTQMVKQGILSQVSLSVSIVAIEILPELLLSADDFKQTTEFILEALKKGIKEGELRKLPIAIKMAKAKKNVGVSSAIRTVINGNTPPNKFIETIFNSKLHGVPFGHVPKGIEVSAQPLQNFTDT